MGESKKKNNLKIIAAFLLGVLAVYLIVTAAVNERLSDLQLETKVLIADQESRLTTIAEITARNGADEITERIIKDCSVAERTRFDELLSSLDSGLSQTQLIELERLFGRCGNFFAERKSVMVSRLSREIELYETFVGQLSNLAGQNEEVPYSVAEWKRLAELEVSQSELFSKLVALQDEIITTLLEGKTASSDEIATILLQVKETQDNLAVANSQASTLRSTLVSL